jgi:hypothetical protein
MKKLLLLSAVLLGAVSASHAGVRVDLGIGIPLPREIVIGHPAPVYVEPAPVYEPAPAYYPPAPVYCPPPAVVVRPPRVVIAPPIVDFRFTHGYHHRYPSYPSHGYRRW